VPRWLRRTPPRAWRTCLPPSTGQGVGGARAAAQRPVSRIRACGTHWNEGPSGDQQVVVPEGRWAYASGARKRCRVCEASDVGADRHTYIRILCTRGTRSECATGRDGELATSMPRTHTAHPVRHCHRPNTPTTHRGLRSFFAGRDQ
jgi:hypothetical protein